MPFLPKESSSRWGIRFPVREFPMWYPLSLPVSAAWTDADPAMNPRPIEEISASQPDAVLACAVLDMMENGVEGSAV